MEKKFLVNVMYEFDEVFECDAENEEDAKIDALSQFVEQIKTERTGTLMKEATVTIREIKR